MILTGNSIRTFRNESLITIDPFNEKHVGPNSYDLMLGRKMVIVPPHMKIDSKKPMQGIETDLTDEGILIEPGNLYLGHTEEVIGSDFFVPMLEGRSSVARMGLMVHITAGVGDLGFIGQWTLEMAVVGPPVRVYPGQRICQMIFHVPFASRPNHEWGKDIYNGKYQRSVGAGVSKSWEDFA